MTENIPFKSELAIRALFNCDLSIKDIVAATGESEHDVTLVIETVCAFNTIQKEKQEEVLALLIDGVPVRAIEMRTCIPRKSILALVRYYDLYNKSHTKPPWPKVCSACNSVILNRDKKTEAWGTYRSPERIPAAEAAALHRIVFELSNVAHLKMTANPLLYGIFMRAKKIINHMTPSERSDDD